jgi:hypothetical protein
MRSQIYTRLQNALLHRGLNAIPSAAAFMIGKRTPIQALTSAASNPQRDRTHINSELSRHHMHAKSGAYSPYHFETLAFNGAFLAMTHSPQNRLPYNKCWANAEPQVLGER